MGRAIIITKPRPTERILGQAIVASTDLKDTYSSFPGACVEFTAGDGDIGDVIQCIITSAITCDVSSVIGPSTPAQGRVTIVNMDELHRCEFLVEAICEPNPYGIKLNDKLRFNDPAQERSVGETVACIPVAIGIGQFTGLVHEAV